MNDTIKKIDELIEEHMMHHIVFADTVNCDAQTAEDYFAGDNGLFTQAELDNILKALTNYSEVYGVK